MSRSTARLSTPTPVVVFPCGSMSTTRTRRPSSASDAPRFTAVVDLPTPPFWLTIAITRAVVCTASTADKDRPTETRRNEDYMLRAPGVPTIWRLCRPESRAYVRRSHALAEQDCLPAYGLLPGGWECRPRERTPSFEMMKRYAAILVL